MYKRQAIGYKNCKLGPVWRVGAGPFFVPFVCLEFRIEIVCSSGDEASSGAKIREANGHRYNFFQEKIFTTEN